MSDTQSLSQFTTRQFSQEEIATLKRWLASPAYWIKDCVLTIDEARANLGLDPERPMPIQELYLRLLLYFADKEPIIWVNKSRRMMATWLFSARLLYQSCFFYGSANFIISRNKEEADQLIEERIKFIYDNIPEKYRNLHPKAHKTKALMRFPEMRSYIRGMPAGPGKIRGKTGSNVFWDEIGAQDKILETWEALRYVIKGGGHIQGVTTPEDNDFKKLFYGLREEQGEI